MCTHQFKNSIPYHLSQIIVNNVTLKCHLGMSMAVPPIHAGCTCYVYPETYGL